ncbi:MAG: leucine-rich repeat domain-containing protein [Desulfosporosinus sp.]|nr:leucine-rich repeat domain-containing protein [Desulfosporosinus sp.]
MRMLKISKVNTFLISIMMMAILLCCSCQVQAAPTGDYTYTVTAGQAQITKYTGAGGVVTIPDTLDGNPVTSIGDNAFYSCKVLTAIIIPQGVTSIGNSAFYGCTGLTAFSIPQGVTNIGNSAFYSCTGLTTIGIPQGIKSIGENAFYNCTGLTAISNPQGVTSIRSMQVFWVITGITILFFAGFSFFIYKTLTQKETEIWSLKRALSEPLRGKDYDVIMIGTNNDVPIYMESSSRLIALVGLSAIIAISIGVAILIFYNSLVQTSKNLDLKLIGDFLIAQAGIFTPYIANQIRSAAAGAGSKS